MTRAGVILAVAIAAAGIGAVAAQQPAIEDLSGDLVTRAEIGPAVLRGILRGPRTDLADAERLGMIETGLTPAFDPKARCRDVDDGWAISYSERRGRPARHGGIDIPAPRGTPIHAVADGVVVGKYLNDDNARGIEVMLRHRPEDTGRAYWIYTQYTHLREMSPLALGQRVTLGDVVGYTANTGISGAEARRRGGDGGERRGCKGGDRIRRDAVHFAVLYAPGPRFLRSPRGIVPQDGRWMDPIALYRPQAPYDSQTLVTLPDAQKPVPIPYLRDDGGRVPANTKLIWPYPCAAR